jgi:RHS repeat-associated protein
LYIYVSNETQNWDVFFDDLAVTHHKGPLTEETHYYPFGLTMAGISSKALASGAPENKYKFNGGTELNTSFDVNLYETNFRSLDPQLGRFWQIDPLADVSSRFSPYCYASDNPIALNDPTGLLSDSLHPQVLPTVIVRPPQKAPVWGGFYWPSMHKNQAKWNDKMYARIRDGQPLQQRGDPGWLAGQQSFHKRNYQAEQEGRKMQLGAVALLAAPIAGMAIVEAAPLATVLTSKVSVEAGLIRVGAQIVAKQYGRALVGATVLNIAQNGGDVRKIDAFDIATSTLNPYGGLSGAIGMAGINSLVDYNPFSISNQQLNYLGNGKNIFQVGFDFSFSAFGEGAKFT